jgi:histidinol-phosphatase (PHP family)
MAPDRLDAYAGQVREMAERVKGLDVVLGAEADWLPGREAHTESVRAQARDAGVEVLLGSVHFLGEWAFDDPNELAEWDRREVDAVWNEYFAHWCDAARSGLFDVMAHPDLPKKFGHRPSFDTADLFEEAARAAAEGGVGIEVSTAGLRRPVAEIYPAADLLAAFGRARVPATVGSDAHSASEVGYGVLQGYDALVAAGYDRGGLPLGQGRWRWVEL